MKTWHYTVASTIVFGICFLVIGCLIFRHLILVCRENASATDISTKTEETYTRFDLNVIHYGTLISAFSFWAVTASLLAVRLFSFARVNGVYTCDTQLIVALEAFVVAKCAMYAVFVARIRACFDDSIYAYSKPTIRGMYAAVAIAFVLFTCALPFSAGANWKDTDYAANGRRVSEKGGNRSMAACVAHLRQPLMPPIIILFDLLFSVIVVVLFTRPLKDMLIQSRRASVACGHVSQSTAKNREQARFELLPLKCTLLSGTAIVSTFLIMAVSGAVRISILFPVDNSVNVACLLLMTNHWKGCYWRVCGPPLRCLSKAHWIAEHNRANIAVISTKQ